MNAIAQRTAVPTSDTAFPATPAWAWGYDFLGQLTGVGHSTDNAFDRAYSFDATACPVPAHPSANSPLVWDGDKCEAFETEPEAQPVRVNQPESFNDWWDISSFKTQTGKCCSTRDSWSKCNPVSTEK